MSTALLVLLKQFKGHPEVADHPCQSLPLNHLRHNRNIDDWTNYTNVFRVYPTSLRGEILPLVKSFAIRPGQDRALSPFDENV